MTMNGKIITEAMQKEAVLGAHDPASLLKQLAATSLQRRAAYIPNTDERTVEQASQELGRWVLEWREKPKEVIKELGAEKLPVPEFEILLHQFANHIGSVANHYKLEVGNERRRRFFYEMKTLRKTRRWLPLRRVVLKRLHPDFWFNQARGDYYQARINGVVYPVKYNMKVSVD